MIGPEDVSSESAVNIEILPASESRVPEWVPIATEPLDPLSLAPLITDTDPPF